MNSSAPFCRDCVHCRPEQRVKTFRMFRPDVYETRYEWAKCARPNSDSSSYLVSGLRIDGNFCKVERNLTYADYCGPEAKFFEAKGSE